MLKLDVRERDDGGRGKDKDIIFGGRCRGKKKFMAKKDRVVILLSIYHQIFRLTSLYHQNSYLGKITMPTFSAAK